MKIVSLQAENIKRIVAVDITPDGTLQVIAGRNGQGKTSVLDAIWWALDGAAALKGTPRPVRDGEDRGHVRLDLGDLVVTRTFTADGRSKLQVEAPDGARYPSPQTMLDRLVGRLSFDPLAFAQLDPRAQVSQLLALIDLPFDIEDLNRDRSVAYNERTEIGRDAARVKGQLDSIPRVDDSVPAELISVAKLLEDLEEAQAAIRARRQADAEVGTVDARIAHLTGKVDELRADLDAATVKLEEAIGERATVVAARDETHQLYAHSPDVDSTKAKLAAADTINEQVRARQARDLVAAQLERHRTDYQARTDEINALDETKRAGLAGARFPVAGLGFDDTGVTYNGIPLGQCSGAERLRVSLAIAMALNPRLRVIRITDGSLLDSENMRLIADMAADRDYQVWVERVDETGAVGIVIEDGAVVERDPVEVPA
jgi:DNA repair exonuclease SbcCD ATPase subunit